MSYGHDESFTCPYCGELNPLLIDISGGNNQTFVVDCTVCCAPILVRLKVRGEEIISLDVRRENE